MEYSVYPRASHSYSLATVAGQYDREIVALCTGEKDVREIVGTFPNVKPEIILEHLDRLQKDGIISAHLFRRQKCRRDHGWKHES